MNKLIFLAVVCSWLPLPASTNAQSPVTWTLDEGISHAAREGKADLFFRQQGSDYESNAIWWNEAFKGGAGGIDLPTGGSANFIGAYVNPKFDTKGSAVIGGLIVDSPTVEGFELQGEYRFPDGFGAGFGIVENENGPDIWFSKATLRSNNDHLSWILEVQAQEFGDHVSPGGYACVYNDVGMVVVGSDGEQQRITAGVIANKPMCGQLRPAFEALFVDNSIGEFDGTKFLFLNGTLGYSGGFLSHQARLGRAMGPQGLEFGNPLGFLRPSWNRRLNTWELGGLANFRGVRTQFPDGSVSERYELLGFPFQPGNGNVIPRLFFGGSWSSVRDIDGWGLTAGFNGKLAFLNVALAVERDLRGKRHDRLTRCHRSVLNTWL